MSDSPRPLRADRQGERICGFCPWPPPATTGGGVPSAAVPVPTPEVEGQPGNFVWADCPAPVAASKADLDCATYEATMLGEIEAGRWRVMIIRTTSWEGVLSMAKKKGQEGVHFFVIEDGKPRSFIQLTLQFLHERARLYGLCPEIGVGTGYCDDQTETREVLLGLGAVASERP